MNCSSRHRVGPEYSPSLSAAAGLCRLPKKGSYLPLFNAVNCLYLNRAHDDNPRVKTPIHDLNKEGPCGRLHEEIS